MKDTDLKVLASKGITEQQVNEQLESFKKGFPFLKIEKAAEIGDGILRFNDAQLNEMTKAWEEYLKSGKKVVKFVPASGAASRMFKNLFEFLEQPYDKPKSDFEVKFFTQIKDFAFYDDLNNVCLSNNAKSIDQLMDAGEYKTIVKNLLEEKGLNYGNLPKGLLKFHKYDCCNRTPVEEHMVEGALYADVNGIVHLHFTVSNDHKELFKKKVEEVKAKYESKYNVKYDITFSIQKPSTDTIAANMDNEPFRTDNGELVFRPGGHGALIENLNDLDGDVFFIKNIDNVVPDKIKGTTVTYKKAIAGILAKLQAKAFEYLKELEGNVSDEKISEITAFCENDLMNKQPNKKQGKEQIEYLKGKLNRPIRVCGMVKNEGEPGGGPYLIINNDGSVSPQILESSQINTKDARSMEIMKTATHFNPVDLVCGTKNYKGEKFDLTKHVDKSTGFISLKSKSGRDLKALELPGLWNGAMSDWNTIFVEVPIETFNPVKTVNDLLRKEHQ